MAGIVAALEADDRVGAAGQPVDDLALALVAPLRPDDGNICHDAVLLNRTLKQVARARRDRKSVVEGKSVSVRVDCGGCAITKKKKNTKRPGSQLDTTTT